MSKKVLLSGANGVVGQPLYQALLNSNVTCVRVSRISSQNGFVKWDMQQLLSAQQKTEIKDCDSLLHCAPIWFLPGHLADLKQAGIKRCVVFSSTSVIGKQHSQNSQEQKIVKLITDAEKHLQQQTNELNIDLTILRPSMIYGYGLDQNISRIARLIQKTKFMPIAGKGSGLRQPVHADDLVQAAIKCLDNTQTIGKIYNLAGGEQLTYRDMVKRIFIAANLKPRMLNMPVKLYRLMLWIASRLTRFEYTADMADRMNQDLVYDIAQAQQDFNYQPQKFLQIPQRDMPSC